MTEHHTQCIDEGTFPGTGNAGDTNTDSISCVGKNRLEDPLGQFEMMPGVALDQRDRPCQYSTIIIKYTLDIFLRREVFSPRRFGSGNPIRFFLLLYHLNPFQKTI